MTDWRLNAACWDIGSDMFFPEVGDNARKAKQVCQSCPVTAECLHFALENGVKAGIWGGLNYKERTRIRRRIA